MKQNKIIIILNKPIKDVFEFTTNPKNTPCWIDSIDEEQIDKLPIKIGTIYKNRSKNSDWNFYKVIELKENKIFTLSDLKGTYFVRYTYTELGKNKTKMEYFEWVNEGYLKEPFTKETLEKLKRVMEKN